MDNHEAEIMNTERAFAELAREKGLKVALVTYASDEAILHRDGKLIKGKDAIGAYFDKQTLRDVRLAWEPDFIDVAASGDLAYTYGRYTLEGTDATGDVIQFDGIFHTVWKRDDNGEWRYVWD